MDRRDLIRSGQIPDPAGWLLVAVFCAACWVTDRVLTHRERMAPQAPSAVCWDGSATRLLGEREGAIRWDDPASLRWAPQEVVTFSADSGRWQAGLTHVCGEGCRFVDERGEPIRWGVHYVPQGPR